MTGEAEENLYVQGLNTTNYIKSCCFMISEVCVCVCVCVWGGGGVKDFFFSATEGGAVPDKTHKAGN